MMAVNTYEGVRRLAIVLKWVGIFGVVVGAFFGVMSVQDGDEFGFIVAIISAGLWFAIFRGGAWILLGFVDPRK